jgi:hypothetical protein
MKRSNRFWYLVWSSCFAVLALTAVPQVSGFAQNKFFGTTNRGVEGGKGNAQIKMLMDENIARTSETSTNAASITINQSDIASNTTSIEGQGQTLEALTTCGDAGRIYGPGHAQTTGNCVSPMRIKDDGVVSTTHGVQLGVNGTCSGANEGTVRYNAGSKAMQLCTGSEWKTFDSAFGWLTDSWSSCSTTCGSGTESRSVSCKNAGGTSVDDTYCSGTKPTSSQACFTTAGCTYSWSYTGWSSCSANPSWTAYGSFGGCSASCGGGTQCRYRSCVNTSGTQSRSASCLRSDGVTVANSFCSGSPQTSQSCSLGCSGSSSDCQGCNNHPCCSPNVGQSCTNTWGWSAPVVQCGGLCTVSCGASEICSSPSNAYVSSCGVSGGTISGTCSVPGTYSCGGVCQ